MSRVRVQKKKFIRNVLIGLVSLLIIAFTLNVAPGYRRNAFGDEINLIFNGRNLTESLENRLYINENGTVFISKEDVKEIFDETIYYDRRNNQVITTSDTKVAVLDFETTEMKLNGVVTHLPHGATIIDGEIYIPISKMGIVYNIHTEFLEENKVVLIESLGREVTIGNISGDIALRQRSRRLSKRVTTLQSGQRVKSFGFALNGWRQIQTEDGQVGFVQASRFVNEYSVRQDKEIREELQEIAIDGAGRGVISRERI